MDAVRAALARRGAPVFFVEQCKLPQTSIQLSVGSNVTGVVRIGHKKIKLENVGSAYLRLLDPPELLDITGVARNGSAWKHALSVQEAIECWADVTPARVVNRPSARGWCESKPFQSRRIRFFGFNYPETLVTTDPEAALRFWRRHEKVIYKSLSSTRSIVARLTSAHRKRLSDLRWCPTQFQQYIPGTPLKVECWFAVACVVPRRTRVHRGGRAQHELRPWVHRPSIRKEGSRGDPHWEAPVRRASYKLFENRISNIRTDQIRVRISAEKR